MHFPRNSDQLSDLRDAAHQRPSSHCHSRGIVRHNVWWIERETPNETERASRTYTQIQKQLSESYEEDKRALKDFFYYILDQYSRNIIHMFSEDRLPPNDKYIIQSGYDKDGLYHRIIVALHFNRVSLKHIVDLEYISKSLTPPRSDPEHRLRTSFHQLESLREEYIRSIRSEGGADAYGFWQNYRASVKEATEYAFDTYWKEQDIAIRDSHTDPTKRDYWGGDTEHRLFQFADLRGLIFPAYSGIHIASEQYISDDSSKISDREVLANNWLIVKSVEYDEHARHLTTAKDIVACGLGNGTGVYVSSLGQKKRIELAHPDIDSHNPLKYFVFCKTNNRRQIGRLIDRLDRIKTYQLLALREHKMLQNKVGPELQTVGNAIDYVEFGHFGNSSENLDTSISILRDVTEAVGIKLDAISFKVDGGLPYRLFNSRHYANALKTLLDSTQIEKISGFETNKEMLERQLYQVFDYIETLGDRYTSLRRRHISLLTRLQTLSLRNISEEILSVQNRANEFRSIGLVVEYVAVSYYGGNIISFGLLLAAQILDIPPGRELEYGVKLLSFACAFIGWLLVERNIKAAIASRRRYEEEPHSKSSTSRSQRVEPQVGASRNEV